MGSLKKIIFIMMMGVTSFLTLEVEAKEITIDYASDGLGVCFNKTTGAYINYFYSPSSSCSASTVKSDRVKYVTTDVGDEDEESKKAYCMDWDKAFDAGKTYVEDSTWDKKSKNALIAGMIVSNIAKDITKDSVGSDFRAQRYALIGATLNTYMAKAGVNDGTYNFYSKNSTVKKQVDFATKVYDKIKGTVSSTKITKPVFSYGGAAMSAVKNSKGEVQNYISQKITFSKVVDTYGYSTYGYSGTSGDGYKAVKVDYTLTGYAVNSSGTKLDNVTVEICQYYNSGKGGTCATSFKYEDLKTENGYAYFYLKLPKDVAEGTKARVVITGNNTSKYWTSGRYIVKGASNKYQRLIVRDSISVAREIKVRLTIPVSVKPEDPGVEYVYYDFLVEKIDEYGNDLSGANLQLYSLDKNNTKKILAESNGDFNFRTQLKFEKDKDTFKEYKYYVSEKSTPDGYVLIDKPIQINVGNSEAVCYNSSGEAVSYEFCEFGKYQYACYDGNEYSELVDGECPTTTTDDNTDPGDSTENAGTESGDTGTDDGVSEAVVEFPSYEKVCTYKENDVIKKVTDGNDYCANQDTYMAVKTSGNEVVMLVQNKKNMIRVSKVDATSKKEVVGAELKICTEKGTGTWEECTPAKTIDDNGDAVDDSIEMHWISDVIPKEFHGLKINTVYYIVEVSPPTGYVKTTTVTNFVIDEKGMVTYNNGYTKITNDQFTDTENPVAIVVTNELNSITFSKQDIATSKELPGATISICQAYKDSETGKFQLVDNVSSDDDCIPPEGMGDDATWVSGSSPKEIKGLKAGYYYLVERIAPTNYSSAESIFFEMRDDGKIYDIDGKLVSKNKIVMYDKKIEEVKTGQLSLYIVIGVLVSVGLLGVGTYYMMHKNGSSIAKFTSKIRKRKIHKKS